MADPRLNRRAPPRRQGRPPREQAVRLAMSGMAAWAQWVEILASSAWPSVSPTGKITRLALVGLRTDGAARSRPGAPEVPWPAENRSPSRTGGLRLAPGGLGARVDRELRWMDEAGAWSAAEALRADAMRRGTQAEVADALGLAMRTYERRLSGGREILGLLLASRGRR